MKRISNIVKGIVGKLPLKNQKNLFERISWTNEKILKHQGGSLVKQITVSGLNISYRRPYELLHTYHELFVNQIYRFKAASDKPVIIDCGSNIGVSVLYFKTLYPGALITAFEPDKQNFSLLKLNVETNKLSGVTLCNSAVWIHNDVISFSSSGSEASHISDGADSSSTTIKATRLNDMLEEHETIDFLKIDIEGAEWEVLKDCAKNLQKVEHLFLEYHGKTGENEKLNNILSIINQVGFSVYFQNAADLLTQPFLHKTTGTLYDVQLNIFCFR